MNNLMTMLTSDNIMQECLNDHRKGLGLPPIDFGEVKSIDDLKTFHISFDDLLDSLNNLKIEDDKAKDDQENSKVDYVD